MARCAPSRLFRRPLRRRLPADKLPTNANKIPKAIVDLKQSRIFLELTAPSRPSQNSRYKNFTSPSSNPIVSSLHSRDFSDQSTQSSQPYTHPSRMTRLLSEIRAERERGEHHARIEALRLENQRREDATARYQAMKIDRTGTDTRQPRERKTRPLGLERTAINIWGAAGIPDVPPISVKPNPEVEPEVATTSLPTTDERVSENKMGQEEEQGVFEKLVEVFSNPSTDQLSPHLSVPASTASHYDADGYHPRWQYTRWHTKNGKWRR